MSSRLISQALSLAVALFLLIGSDAAWTQVVKPNSLVENLNDDYEAIASSSDGKKVVAVTDRGNIWTSSDSGATMTEVVVGGESKYWEDVACSSDGTKIVAVEYESICVSSWSTYGCGHIHFSSDSGATWTQVTDEMVEDGDADKEWEAVTVSSDGTKLAATLSSGNIWISSDSAATWTEITVGGGSISWDDITSSSDGTKLAATTEYNNIWTSSDSGATWTEITVGDGLNNWDGITSSSDGAKLAAVVSLGNIWRSSDSGATWTEVVADGGLNNWDGIASSDDGTKLVAVKWHGNIFTSSDSGASWTEVSVNASQPKSELDRQYHDYEYWNGVTLSADGMSVAAITGSGSTAALWISSDGGTTMCEGCTSVESEVADALALILGIVITIVVVSALAGAACCCFFCSSCPGYKMLNKDKDTTVVVPAVQIIVAPAPTQDPAPAAPQSP